MGHVISAEGLTPDPTKIEAVLSMPTPTNKQEVQRLLGMVNYLQKFSPNRSDITAPLRELLQEDIMFQCNQQVSTRYTFASPKDSTHHSSSPQVI